MILSRPFPRYIGLWMVVVMAVIAVTGYFAIRRDVENLREISQDNLLWTATQMEVELLRFEVATALVASNGTQESLDAMREQFDILWSRVSLIRSGRIGEVLRGYDAGHGAIMAIADYLKQIDATVAALDPSDTKTLNQILSDVQKLQQALRLYTLRVVRGDTGAEEQVRDHIQSSALITAAISAGVLLVLALSVVLVLRENKRQRVVAEMNLEMAEAAEASSRAKSRFLTMMSHELRNPLNGVLGPLALLGQSDIPAPQKRLVEQANLSGKSMLQMLSGLLDYGEMQGGQLRLRCEPFRIAALAEGVHQDLAGLEAAEFAVSVAPDTPEMMYGDQQRLRQIFVHLGEYVLETCDRSSARLTFSLKEDVLIGEFSFASATVGMDWRLGLLSGMSESAPDQVTAEALRPLIARGLISAANGVLTLGEEKEGRRVIRVAIPARPVEFERIRVHLETRSTALAAIYRAALRSDRVIFVDPDGDEPVDLVLVDATIVGADPLMSRLRERFPNALFVSLGQPRSPGYFDDIVEVPGDMGRLRTSVFARLAS